MDAKTSSMWVVMKHDWDEAWPLSVWHKEVDARRERKRLQKADTAEPPYGYSEERVPVEPSVTGIVPEEERGPRSTGPTPLASNQETESA